MQWEFRPEGQRRSPWVELSDDAGGIPRIRSRRPTGREEHSMQKELKEDKIATTWKAQDKWGGQRIGRVARPGPKRPCGHW